MTGAQLIAEERKKQIEVFGFTAEHDDKYEFDMGIGLHPLYAAAMSYEKCTGDCPIIWPWSKEWWKPATDEPIKDLTKSGALYTAELERVQRLETKQPGYEATIQAKIILVTVEIDRLLNA